MREYLRVTPTSEEVDPKTVPRVIESLHKLTSTESPGLRQKLNPLHSDTPPRFEFLAMSEGPAEPVKFYYGADDHLDTLEKRLRSIYPSTFDIERIELDVGSRLIEPVEFTEEEFVDRYESGQLRYEFGEDERHEPHAVDRSESDADPDGLSDTGDTGPESTPAAFVEADDTVLELAPPGAIPADESFTELDRPTMTDEGTVLARPARDTVSPFGVRWCGSADRKQDWMTSLPPLAAADTDGKIESVDQPGAALATLVDHLTEATVPVAFQVVFQRREDWQSDADLRKENIANGRDTLTQKTLGPFLEGLAPDDEDSERQLSDAQSKRIKAIDAKNSKQSFTVNIRAIGVPTDDRDEELDSQMDSLASVFDQLEGKYYEVTGARHRDSGFREKTKTKNARAALDRLLDRELTTGRGKTRPDLVLSGAELAHFLLVPSSEQLTVEGTRGARAEQQSRNPLQLPNPDLLHQFSEGMAVGHALDENGDPISEPVRIPPDLLTTHYGRFASTGSGKSKAIINDALSLRETTGGPVVIVDPKGDGMCENYLRCHYERFGGLDDVHQFRVPETIPAFSFFDIRPALEAGRNREDAIQDKVDHFHDIMRMNMNEDQYDRAFVGVVILSYLIKALFDEEYGSDVFGLDDLYEAVRQMQNEKTIPPVSAANQDVEESLTDHFKKDEREFQTSMGAAKNRLDKLKEDDHIQRIFNHAPEQNDAGEYVDNRFDFREFLDEDVTILIDIGDLRPRSQRAFTMLLLSNLWDAVQVRRRDGKSGYENPTNLILEEAAPIVSTDLVYEQLLPQGRSFGLSMGLVMQFPEQVRNRSDRAYSELLNNIKTKFIGNISIERDLAESLAHEDLSPTELRNRINTLPSGEWIVQLPSPSFGRTGPVPFSLQPLPIAAGHPESDQPLTEPKEEHFETVSRPRMIERTQAQYALPKQETDDQNEHSWGSSPDAAVESSGDGTSTEDTSQSAFIDQATAKSTATAGEGGDAAEAETGVDSPPGSISSFGVQTGDEDPADGQEATAGADESTTHPEPGSTPVKADRVSVPDEELQRRGLTHDDVRFLNRVLDVMNRESAEYTLLDSMTHLRDEYEDLHLDRLQEQNLLDEASACGRKYYTVLPAGRELLGKKLQVGPGKGDIGEKTPHKVGVRLLELALHRKDGVDRVESYYEREDGAVFDVAGFDADGELVWVGEAELASNNSQAPVDDYDKMSSVDADAIWGFDSHETALEVLDSLAEADRLEERISGRDTRSFTTVRNAVEDLDAAGMTTVRGFKNLDQEVNQ